MSLDPRLEDAKLRSREWKAFRERLVTLGYSDAATVIERCTSRIDAQIHEKRWPLVWWRFLTIDAAFHDMSTYFHRMDGEGMFFGEGRDGYAPERKEILSEVERLHAIDELAARGKIERNSERGT